MPLYPSIDDLGALSLGMIYTGQLKAPLEFLGPYEGKNHLGGRFHTYKSCTGHVEVVLLSYVENLDSIVDASSDHLFFLGGDVSFVMGQNGQRSYDYRIVASLHTVCVEKSGRNDVGPTSLPFLDVRRLLRREKKTWRAERFLRMSDAGELRDPWTEYINPPLAKRSRARMARRVRRQICPAGSPADIVSVVEKSNRDFKTMSLDWKEHWYLINAEFVQKPFLFQDQGVGAGDDEIEKDAPEPLVWECCASTESGEVLAPFELSEFGVPAELWDSVSDADEVQLSTSYEGIYETLKMGFESQVLSEGVTTEELAHNAERLRGERSDAYP
ncbi:hypothetical protein QBC44DRAFT_363795 [Cladorrhinum sp. PSN332]|nr:hypothetical protein QBC44DRAFT_363795 [Cladorrhinum sp. PSN332]